MMHNPDTIKIPSSKPRNPLAIPVKKKGVQKHRNRKREDRQKHFE